MNRFLSILLALVMVACLAACGGNSQSGGKGSDGEIEAIGSEYAKDIMLPDLENKEVSWLLSAGYDEHKELDSKESPDGLYQAWKVWEETYGVKVDVQVVAWDNFTSYLSTAAASGEMPDIVYGGTTWFPSWPAKGLVQPLEKYMDFSDDMWNKQIMDQLKWDGKYYVAYAQQPENFYICYNKTKFELSGETTPLEHWKNGTWNWTQFAKTAQNMTDKANNEYGYTGWNLGFSKCIYSIVDIDETGKLSSKLTSSNVKRWFTEVYNLYHSGAARSDNDKGNYLTTFPAGRDAMIHVSPEEYVRMQKMLKVTGGDEFEVAPSPIFDPNGDTVSKTTANIYGYSISSQAKNPKGAATLIELYYKIYNNIQDSFGELGQFGSYLSDDEKQAIKEADKTVTELNFIQGFGNAQALFNTQCGNIIYSSNQEGSVSSMFDSFNSMLNAELEEFSGSIGE